MYLVTKTSSIFLLESWIFMSIQLIPIDCEVEMNLWISRYLLLDSMSLESFFFLSPIIHIQEASWHLGNTAQDFPWMDNSIFCVKISFSTVFIICF